MLPQNSRRYLNTMLEDYIWTILENNNLPILFYGTGDGADKLLKIFDDKKLKCEAFIVSDDFYRGQSFKGYKCMTVSMAEEIYKDFICLVSFGTRIESVIENIKKISGRHTVFIPSTPLFGDRIFDKEYYETNISKIEETKSLFEDELSVRTIDDIIKFRLTSKPDYLYDCMEKREMFDCTDSDYTAYVDLGAYRGDTLKDALEKYESLEKIICFEPASNPFRKLSEYVSSLDSKYKITLVNKGAYDSCTKVSFLDGGGKGSHVNTDNSKSLSGAKSKDIEMCTLDSVSSFKNERLLIKYDVEGEEMKALFGSEETIKANKTDLIISLYHKCGDIFDLPLYISKQYPNSKMKLRKFYGIPDWDILLFVKI